MQVVAGGRRRQRHGAAPERSGSGLGLGGGLVRLGLRGTWRRDPKADDLIALPLENLEVKAVKGEDLAAFRYLPRLVQHQPGDGRRFLVGQAPAEFAVEEIGRAHV